MDLATSFSRGSGGASGRAGQKNGVQKSSLPSGPHHPAINSHSSPILSGELDY